MATLLALLLLLPADLVIRGVTVLDGTGAAPLPDRTVLVVGRHIAAIGDADLPVPAGTPELDGAGRWLTPGLWDLHVHPDDPEVWHLEPPEAERERFLPLFVAAGVTAVRDMGGDLERLDRWRAAIAAGDLVGPHIVRGGPLVDGPEPMWPGSVAVADAAAGRAAVDALAARGVDFIKVYSLLPADAFAAIAGRCRELDLPFAGHVPRSSDPFEAATLGMASQEHLLGMVRASADPERLEQGLAAVPEDLTGTAARNARIEALFQAADPERTVALARHLARHRTAVVPTLILWKRRAWFDPEHPRVAPFLPLMPATIQAWWSPDENIHLRELSPESMAGERLLFARYLEIARALHEAGVPLLPGTDTGGNPHLFPGFSLHDELELLVDAVGLTPAEALSAATARSADLCRVRDRGRVAVGQVADLLLLEADPHADIRHLREPLAVVLAGRLLDRQALADLRAPD